MRSGHDLHVMGVLLAGLLLCLSHVAKADGFAEALHASTNGGVDQAAVLFRQYNDQHPSSGGFYNLGNIEWKRGAEGEAILAWEQALWLNPWNGAAKTNLDYARSRVQLPAPQMPWYEICSSWLPASVWPVLTAVSFWLAMGLVILPGIFGWKKADWRQAVVACCLTVFLLSLPALYGVHTRSNMGVVRMKNTALRLTPTKEAQVMGRLAAGEVVRVERRRGGYLFIRLGGDSSGWIEQSAMGWIGR